MLLKPGLDIIVLCHPGDRGLAERPFDRIWEHLHRERSDTMAGGSVEVYLHSRAWDGESGPPRWLAVLEREPDGMDEAWFTTVVPVLGPALARAYSQDPVWASAIDRLLEVADGSERLEVAALQTGAVGVQSSPLWRAVKRRLTLDARSADDGAVLCREIARTSAQTVYRALGETDPIKIFVSHAKRDLEPDGIVAVVREVPRDMRLREFFDAVDLQPDELLADELREAAATSAMLAVPTEHYCGSEWTLEEITIAKAHDRAIAGVADLGGRGEHRSFIAGDFRVVHPHADKFREAVERALNPGVAPARAPVADRRPDRRTPRPRSGGTQRGRLPRRPAYDRHLHTGRQKGRGMSEATIAAAFTLQVELPTRIATRPLPEGQGLLSEALESLKVLFDAARAAIRELGSANRDGEAALLAGKLCETLRPFLTEWHPRLDDHLSTRPAGVGVLTHERAWDDAAALRAELPGLQATLTEVLDRLRQITGSDL